MSHYDNWKTTNEEWETPDCEPEFGESDHQYRVVVAKKDYHFNIKAGDLVSVSSYYTYDYETGKVTGYNHVRIRQAKGVAHADHDPVRYAKVMETVLACRAERREKAAARRETLKAKRDLRNASRRAA